MREELNRLNPAQREAVERINGRVLILAGAGSGKTRVLTLRMAYLILQKNVLPENILGLTFTNKAAAEMRQRLALLVSPAVAKRATLCTFHSFCMHLLRKEIQHLGYTSQFSLYDEQDTQRLIKAIVRDLLEHEGELPSLEPTRALLRDAQNKGIPPESLLTKEASWHESFTQELYQRLKGSMRAYNAVDFDGLLSLSVELFQKFPDILDRYQERFRYIMIDEYQDTNPVQYQLASQLAAKYQNLCVVGDDDQSIYGWRGADIRNILDFKYDTSITLQDNYRSTSTILKAANAVIAQNTQRHLKILRSNCGEGAPIDLFHAPSELEEADAVVERIVSLKERAGLEWKDIAILYRSNALARHFELALMKRVWHNGQRWLQGIPYEVFGGTEFYERREVKDLSAYLRVILNPLDQEALLRIVNQPRRGIGDESLDLLTGYNRQSNIPLWEVLKQASQLPHIQLQTRVLKSIEGFVHLIEEAKKRFAAGKLTDGLEWLIQTINYKKAIEEEVKSPQMRNFKWENVQEFVASLASFTEAEEAGTPEDALLNFLSLTSLNRDYQRSNPKEGARNCVHLMTFHSAKGLEFPACFLVGMEDHILPHEKSLRETGIEEERRLLYVALTRAKEHLTISMAKQRKRLGKDAVSRPSRFLFDIPKELLCLTDWRSIISR